jgi:RNA polymerase sigma factor (sigma-70 family)
MIHINRKPAAMNLKHRLKYIKRTLKERIVIYKPLDFTSTYKEVIQSIQDGELHVIKKIPINCRARWCLDLLIKNILIARAYYVFGEKYIQQRLMNRLGISDHNDIKLLEIVDFIMERLEWNSLEKLKKFKEKCKFKTFLSLLVVSLLMDFWRKKYRAEKNKKKYKTDLEASFNPPMGDPLVVLIDEETRNQAVQILPRILEGLNPEEKIIYQLIYEMEIKKTSEIARRLGTSRHKTKQLIKKLERKIRMELFLEGVVPHPVVPKCIKKGRLKYVN